MRKESVPEKVDNFHTLTQSHIPEQRSFPTHRREKSETCNFGSFLGAIEKLRKITNSFFTTVFLSVCPSVCLSVSSSTCNNFALTGRILIKFDLNILIKSVKKIQFTLKSDSNNLYFT